MASLWALGGLTWKELGRRVWDEANKDDVWGRAAQLAYYFLLALFPLLIFLTTVFGYVAGEGSELRQNLLSYFATVLPPSAADLVNTTLEGVINNASGGKLSFGILATLWAASNGLGAITEALNVAYDVEETRSFIKRRLIAIGLTVALAVLIITALTLVLYGGRIAEAAAASFGLGDLFTTTWKIAQWPLVLGFVLLAFASVYYFAPNLSDQKFAWITPGSIVGVALWLLVSFAFRAYLHFFDSYSATYGSLGAVIILMLWLYLSGLALLIGGEVNSEIENAAAKTGHPEAKEKGEKAPQQKKPNASAAAGSPASSSAPNRQSPAASRESATPKEAFSLRKTAVVLGAFFWSRLRGKNTNR